MLHKLMTLAVAMVPLTTSALNYKDLNIHGFVSQAFIHSDGNNIYGDSTSGSTDFFEAGVNANYQFDNGVSLAGQLFSRDAGNADNGDIKIDYLFADFKAAESERSGMGVRVGRVRNSIGFYNETRDVIFTRPTIIHPQAVYYEGNGLRELMFSSEGAQLYSYWDDDNHSTSFNLTYGRDKSISRDVLRNITGGSSNLIKGEIESPLFAQILHSRNGGRSRYALSILDVALQATKAMPMVPLSSVDAVGFILSAERNWPRFSLTSEYSRLNLKNAVGAVVVEESYAESAYLQGRYRVLPSLLATLRYEFSRTVEDGDSRSHNRHWVAGVQWLPTSSWILALDIYEMDGTAGIPGVDNMNRPLSQRTQVVAAVVGYRF
ncbi:Uncharacterised protein [Zhongshania aliphaticivorans]|uniref:Porin domain-containing protein n=1 Tax=Zhongshania aliphaticivorans TaxID=1470434 RepID=A0A5S9P3X5_9GAMM|nr:hypothetical protein [Zhongshania aliphaticivorans]CAA0090550.1 Uncharacterised protein [Zhongshania aliphaticivorans]CAA0098028.1 Uncharacterised protein [Zhongshania aliphaticivorans]